MLVHWTLLWYCGSCLRNLWGRCQMLQNPLVVTDSSVDVSIKQQLLRLSNNFPIKVNLQSCSKFWSESANGWVPLSLRRRWRMRCHLWISCCLDPADESRCDTKSSPQLTSTPTVWRIISNSTASWSLWTFLAQLWFNGTFTKLLLLKLFYSYYILRFIDKNKQLNHLLTTAIMLWKRLKCTSKEKAFDSSVQTKEEWWLL